MDNSTNRIIGGPNLIKILLMVYFMYALLHIDFNQPDKSFAFLGVSVLTLLTGLLLRSFFVRYSSAVMKTCAAISFVAFYLAAGAWVLGNSGDGGQFNNFEPGSKVSYDIQFRTPLNIPVSVDYVLPVKLSGMKYLSSQNKELMNERSIGYKYGLSLIFKIERKNAYLPKRVIVIYRAYKVLPMINIVDLRWPDFPK